MDIVVEVDAKKEVLSGEQAWEVLQGADTVYVASGKKTIEFVPSSATRDELMKKATGRTGNLRAPVIKKKNVLYVGYNQEMYETIS
jgi:hypothetical protein